MQHGVSSSEGEGVWAHLNFADKMGVVMAITVLFCYFHFYFKHAVSVWFPTIPGVWIHYTLGMISAIALKK